MQCDLGCPSRCSILADLGPQVLLKKDEIISGFFCTLIPDKILITELFLEAIFWSLSWQSLQQHSITCYLMQI